MTDPLRLVWERADLSRPLFGADEVAGWPPGAVERLEALGLLARAENADVVACDACGHDHVEEVTIARAPSTNETLGLILCPEVGRVRVPLDRLRRWTIDFARLASRTADALEMAGQVEELIPARVWRLGRTSLPGRARPVLLVRGLGWDDGPSLLARVPELRVGQGLVLVPGAAFPAPEGLAARLVVAPLSSVVTLGPGGLAFDLTPLVERSGQSPRHQAAGLAVFPTPVGTTWGDVRLEVDDLHLRVEVNGLHKRFGFKEAGFEDRRRGDAPNKSWALLRVLALRAGALEPDDRALQGPAWAAFKQQVSQLGIRLRRLLQLDGKPLELSGRRCRALFQITPHSGLPFPTPAGAEWDQVTIREIRDEVVEVAVESLESAAAFVYGDDEGRTGRWEAALAAGVRKRTYALPEMGLSGGDGVPSPAGELVLRFLRGGRVRGQPADPAVVRLGVALSKLLQIDDSPFQYVRAKQHWVPQFEASSFLADARG